jgi:hypothetical protein
MNTIPARGSQRPIRESPDTNPPQERTWNDLNTYGKMLFAYQWKTFLEMFTEMTVRAEEEAIAGEQGDGVELDWMNFYLEWLHRRRFDMFDSTSTCNIKY